MKRILLFIIFALFISGVCYAAPSINSYTGTVESGATVVISGAGFGANDLDYVWTGTAIEAGTSGVSAYLGADWTNYNGRVLCTNADYHSGSKSLTTDAMESNPAFMAWDYGGAVPSSAFFHIAFWTKIPDTFLCGSDSGVTCQWKMWRFVNAYLGQANANTTGFLASLWPKTPNDWYMVGSQGFRTAGTQTGTCNSNYFGAENHPEYNTWFRLDYYLQVNSGDGNEDGLKTVWLDCDNQVMSGTACVTHDTGDIAWRYCIFGYDMTNNQAGADGEVYWDDIYIAKTRARVEIGNNSVWANCTIREVQQAVDWADGEITLLVNQGGLGADLENGTLYFHVVDSSGDSDSFQITGGGESSPTGSASHAGSGISGGGS